MNLTLNQKAELDAMAKNPGGKTMLIRLWEKDPLMKSLVRRGLTRWGKVRHGMREHMLTKEGMAVAKRFKKDWSSIWGDLHPELGAEQE